MAIGNLSLDSDKKKIGRQGGVDAVVKAMLNHTAVEGVQAQGCWAIAILALDDDVRKEVARLGGFDAVVRAMEAYESAASLQEYCIWALLQVDWSVKTPQDRIRNAHAKFLVTKAMEATNASASTSEYGQQLLDKLCQDQDQSAASV